MYAVKYTHLRYNSRHLSKLSAQHVPNDPVKTQSIPHAPESSVTFFCAIPTFKKKNKKGANLDPHGLISLSALQLYVNGAMHVCYISFLSFCIMVSRFTHDVVYSCSSFHFIMSHVGNYFLPCALLECFYLALSSSEIIVYIIFYIRV